MNKDIITRNLKNSEKSANEDVPVIDFINSLNSAERIKWLEVGSGECRFVKKIMQLYPKIDITCIEISPSLAKIAKDLGVRVINKNVLDVTDIEEYDIVHCSHVIEHFGYPHVVQFLDFLVNSTKTDGHLIIRSPLMWKNFYWDMDHIRPYRPESILDYFRYNQQQKAGNAKVEEVLRWYRTAPKSIDHIGPWDWLFLLKPLRGVIDQIIDLINQLLENAWNRYRMPSSKPTGYVQILKIIEKF